MTNNQDFDLRMDPVIIKAHIDMMIHHWRSKMYTAENGSDQLIASSHVDAYQSMRVALFDEKLPLDDWQK